MKPEELRIGNWINWKGIHDIQIETEDFAELCENDSYFERGRPIELTEEWLIKFGFNNEIKYSFSSGQKKEYKVFDKEPLIYNNIQKVWWISGYHPKIEYVHQLQNLYYCLCGKELILK